MQNEKQEMRGYESMGLGGGADLTLVAHYRPLPTGWYD